LCGGTPDDYIYILYCLTTELSKEKDKLKKSAGEATDGGIKTPSADGVRGRSDGLMEELQVVRSERDRAVREEKTLRQSLSLMEQETEVRWHAHILCPNFCHFLCIIRPQCNVGY
jgi:hypothetical protein